MAKDPCSLCSFNVTSCFCTQANEGVADVLWGQGLKAHSPSFGDPRRSEPLQGLGVLDERPQALKALYSGRLHFPVERPSQQTSNRIMGNERPHTRLSRVSAFYE